MEKKTERITYLASGGEEIVFPVATVTGNRPGPHAVITAGIHGCEYSGIAAAIRLFQQLDPNSVKGRITIITISSLRAFEERRMFVCPVDGKNPNRVFPGGLGGSYTEQQAYYLMEDFIAKSDYYLDLHGGDMVEDLEEFSIYHAGAGAVSEQSLELALYYGLPNIVSTETDGAWPDRGTTYSNAARRGIPAAIVEAGAAGQLTERAVDRHLRGLLNVLRHFGNLDGDSFRPQDVRMYHTMKWVYTTKKGFFYPNVAVGQEVKNGQCVGRVEDYFGNLLEESTVDFSGRVLFLTTSPAMTENGLIMGVGIQ